MTASKKSIGSKEINQKYCEQLKNGLTLIKMAMDILIKTKKQELRWVILATLLGAIRQTCDSIILLIEYELKNPETVPKIRDIYILSRSVIETIINGIFILAKGDEAAEKARAHWLQRSYRDLDRELTIGNQFIKKKYFGKAVQEQFPDLQKSIEDFTNKKGKEIHTWTEESVVEKLKEIHSKYGTEISTPLQMGFFAIYDDASQFSHGSFFGALDILGLTDPKGLKPPNEQEFESRCRLSLVCQLIFYSIIAIIEVLTEELQNKKLQNSLKKTKKSFDEFQENDILEAQKNETDLL
jgi:hypothetical protein